MKTMKTAKTILLTGGGTAGHITPNLALLPSLREKGFVLHYVGLAGGMEEALVKQQGVPFYGIHGGKLRRYFDLKNLTDLFKIGAGFFEALGILRRVEPDAVFSKGGFVSAPVVWAASALRIPVVSHESDGTIGLANKLTLPFVQKVCYTFPQTGKLLPEGKAVFTGLPIRRELARGSAAAGRALCGFSGKKPVLLSVGGSQGAQFINELLRSCLNELLPRYDICHLCGKGQLAPELAGTQGYRQFEYITKELPDLFAMADFVVSRAGATSIFELLALKKPSLLIPYSLKASRGDQIDNAEFFRQQGFSEVMAEAGATKEEFVKLVNAVYENRGFYTAKMEACPFQNGVENVVRVICSAAGAPEA